MNKLTKYLIPIKVYGVHFNIEVRVLDSKIGRFVEEQTKCWMPSFGPYEKWQVVYIGSGIDSIPEKFKIGVKLKDGNRVKYHSFDLSEVELVPVPTHTSDSVNKLISKIAGDLL